MNHDFSKLVSVLELWHIDFSDLQLLQFEKYYEMLIEKNKVMNLTAITDFSDVVDKHFIDSVALAKYIDLSGLSSIIDIGSGAGFPGIPLKILFPHLDITLADSLNKRILFLNEVIDALGLYGVKAVHGRAEDLAMDNDYRESYDLCVSRAVANLSILSEYCIPFVKPGGYFIAYKSANFDNELSGAERAISLLGGSVERSFSFIVDYTDLNRAFIIIKKIKRTPRHYPRKSGMPTKCPL